MTLTCASRSCRKAIGTSVPELYIRTFPSCPCPVCTQCPVYILNLNLKSLACCPSACCTAELRPLELLHTYELMPVIKQVFSYVLYFSCVVPIGSKGVRFGRQWYLIYRYEFDRPASWLEAVRCKDLSNASQQLVICCFIFFFPNICSMNVSPYHVLEPICGVM